jgi:tyrosinase
MDSWIMEHGMEHGKKKVTKPVEVKVRGKIPHSPHSLQVKRLNYRYNYPNYRIKPTPPGKPDERKDQSKMTQSEKDRFVSAYLGLNIPANLGTMVAYHADMATFRMHSNPRFLPWHRVFLSELEEMLQGADPDITIPYWDWTKDRSIPPWLSGVTPTVRLPNGSAVTVTRMPGLPDQLPPQGDVDIVMALDTYDDFNDGLEGGTGTTQTRLHNSVHVWVGGAMGSIPTAAADPLFWLHHCNIDRIWSQWQKENPNVNPILVGDDAIMSPWRVTEEETRDTLNFGYVYV